MIRRLLVAVVLSGCTLMLTGQTASQALAQDDEAARQHFRLGQAYYENGQVAQTATEFEEAYRLSGRSALLYNVYLSHRDALHTRESYEALNQYLNEVPDPPDEDRLRARLRHLEEALADEPEVTEPTETTEPVETTPPAVTPPPTPPVSEPPPPEPESPSVIPYVVMGAGGAVIVGGVVAALLSRGARSDLDALCDANGTCPAGSNWESLRDRGQRSARAADALIGIGAAAAVSGVVLYFVMRPSDDDESGRDAEATTFLPSFACDAHGCAAALGGQF